MKSALYLCLLLLGFHVQGLPKLSHSEEQEEQKVVHSPGDHAQGEGEKRSHCKIAPSNAEFAFRFYKQVAAEGGDKNIFFSPVSISVAFAMLSLGARAATCHELHKGLTFNMTEMEEHEVHEGFRDLLQLLNDPHREVQLSMGNALFIDDHLKLLQKFLDDVTNFYDSEAISINFQNISEAKKKINDYIERKTHGKFVDFLQSLDSDTVLVLVNHIFFKGYWEQPFSSLLTKDAVFFIDDKRSVKVKMMHRSKNYNVYRDEELSCWAVEIPYKGNVAALFVLPDEGAMKQVEDALRKETVANWGKSLKSRKIHLYLPKFSISGCYDVKDLFRKMGVTEVFSDEANLSGMTESTRLKVSKAMHKAMVDVNENGTEAAAVTVVEVMPLLLDISPPPVIQFNKPFLVIMFDKTSRSILFLGKVMNPAASED